MHDLHFDSLLLPTNCKEIKLPQGYINFTRLPANISTEGVHYKQERLRNKLTKKLRAFSWKRATLVILKTKKIKSCV